MDPDYTAQSLQDKVQFNIRFYFARTANENINKFTKKTFVSEVDPNTGIKYIRKDVDEQTKNHQMDTEMSNNAMTEFKSSCLCPVSSYLKYLSKLHPQCDYLWQQVKDQEKITDADIWYKPSKIGPNPLAGFMSRVSHNADLSKVYTNHSIRSTATTFLRRANFTPKQVMSVTGHRSVNSLSVYEKISANEHLPMRYTMSCLLQGQNQNQINPRPKLQAIAPKPKDIPAALGAPANQYENTPKSVPRQEVVAFEPEDPLLQEDFNHDLNFDVESVLQDIEKQLVSLTQTDNNANTTTSMMYQKETYKKSPNIPIFNNCKIGSIGNLHIHFHKN